MTACVLGIDIGTASSKGVLVTLAGDVVARASRPHETSMPHPRWAEHDAERLWWSDFCALATELVATNDHHVEAVCVSGIGPCVLPTDEDATPLRPAILYGVVGQHHQLVPADDR